MKPCKVRQYSDMTKCESCGLCWDTNDQYPPECKMYNDQEHEHEGTPKNALKALLFCAVFLLLIVFLLDC
jgi:hypothetical protein